MDRQLINIFREKINDQDLVYQMYHDHNGKDQWNIICSAMDWIDVVVGEIDASKLSRKNDNASSVKVMTFINCIDVLWEAVQQLHRIFFETAKVPFSDDHTAFTHKLFPSSDNKYFKTIRACFSAHPVNLEDDFRGINKKEKRYASWSGGGFGRGDFSVRLYSNRSGCEDLCLDIYFDELMDFAQKRYDYLRTIMDEIDIQIAQYMSIWKDTIIPKVQDPLKQIETLIDENKKRIKNDYYAYELHKLQIIFSTTLHDTRNAEASEIYRKALIPVIDEIYMNLQMMTIEDLQSSDALNDTYPEACQYAFSKLSDAVYSNGSAGFISIKSLDAYLSSVVNILECDSLEELYVTVLAGFYILCRT